LKDCTPPIRERLNLWLIGVGCWIMSVLRDLRRPGSLILMWVAVALTTATVAREADWPETWWETGWGRGALIALTALTGAGTVLVVQGYRRFLRRDAKKAALREGAESIAQLVEKQTSLTPGEFGVHIWLVRGMKGFRRLVRGPSQAREHHETPIVWTKGKGVIGQAWKRRKTRYADLDLVRELYPSQEDWCGQKREKRFRLSWDEFEETRRYRAVVAVPLRAHRFARYRVRGVIAIDALVSGKAAELEALEKTPEFSAIRRLCESAFVRDPREE
jgi:hypothetical protein